MTTPHVADRRRRWTAAATVAAVLVFACGGAEGASPLPGARVHSIDVGDSLNALGRPAAFAGSLPCDGCDGIDLLLVLHPDGSYRSQDRYRGARHRPDPIVEVGRWILRADSVPRLTLLGGTDGPRHFTMESELRLRALDGTGAPHDTAAPHELVRISAPRVVVGTVRTRGRFRDFADSPTLVTCASGTQLVVGGDSAFVRLQRETHRLALGTGAGILVDLVARLEDRPGMEEGTRAETAVVDAFTVAEPTAACEATRTRAVLAVGDWEMTALDGDTLPELTPELRPTLRFLLGDATMAGNAGCNRFTGHAVLRGLDLVPRPVALTRRACADSTVMAREQRYTQILGEGGWFRLDAGDLVLAHGGVERARFRRR